MLLSISLSFSFSISIVSYYDYLSYSYVTYYDYLFLFICSESYRKNIICLTFPAGILTERLGLGTKGFFAQHRKTSPTSPTKPKPEKTPIAVMPPRFQSHPSIESANTISNSSLQDLDETEFTGTELARYMGELNFDLVTWHSFQERRLSK